MADKDNMEDTSLNGMTVSIGLRYATEVSSVVGVVRKQTAQGVYVDVKKSAVFYPWTSVIYIKYDVE